MSENVPKKIPILIIPVVIVMIAIVMSFRFTKREVKGINCSNWNLFQGKFYPEIQLELEIDIHTAGKEMSQFIHIIVKNSMKLDLAMDRLWVYNSENGFSIYGTM